MEGSAGVGKWKHRLSNIDLETKRADCAECGPNVPIKVKKPRPRCRRAEDQWNKPSSASGTTPANITRKDRGEFLAQQSGCSICGRSLELVLDHCHYTGAVRGGLCRSCNIGLGFFDDNPAWLMAAARYVIKAKNGPLTTQV